MLRVTLLLALAGCPSVTPDPSDSASSTDSASDTDSTVDTDSPTDTDSEPDTDTDTDSDTDTDTGADTGSDTDTGSDPNTDPPPARLSHHRWKPVFADEFDGAPSGGDPCFDREPVCMDRYWSTDACPSTSHANLADLNKCTWAVYDIYNWMDWGKPLGTGINNLDPHMVSVHDGSLWLDAEPVADAGNGFDCGNELPDSYVSKHCPVRSGAVSSNPTYAPTGHEQTYGRFEVRAIIPNQMGAWPAHWMLPTNGGWPSAGEIDVMEAVAHDPSDVHGTFHGGTHDGTTNTHHSKGNHHDPGDPRFASDWHTYAVEWEPSELRFFVDDLQIGRVAEGELLETTVLSSTSPSLKEGDSLGPLPVDVPDAPFFFILNTSIVPTGGFDLSAFQALTHRIDWVRFYEPCAASDTDPACEVRATGTANITDASWMSGPKWSPEFRTMSVVDLDGNGQEDLLLRTRKDAHATYWLGGAERGGFDHEYALTELAGTSAAHWNDTFRMEQSGDFDGDGDTDLLLIGRSDSHDTYLLRSDGAGGFAPVQKVTQSWGLDADAWRLDHHRVVAADFDGDGDTDVLLVGTTQLRSTYLLVADGSGGFVSAQDITKSGGMSAARWSAALREPLVGDFDGDGDADLLLRSLGGSEPTFLLKADGSGGFGTRFDVTEDWGMWDARWSGAERVAHIGDFDGDGTDDLFLQGRSATDATLVLLADGSGGFEDADPISSRYGLSRDLLASDGHEGAIGDFDGDGADDLLLRNREDGGRTWLLRGKLGGGFHDVVDITDAAVMGSPLWAAADRELAVGDFDGDGADDVVLRGGTADTSTFVVYVRDGL